MRTSRVLLAMAFLSSCSKSSSVLEDSFIQELAPYCGKSFHGKLVSSDPQDATFAAATITLTLESCTADEVHMPLAVGENTSRTWVITDRETYLTLQHMHLHEDGTEDKVSRYGGDSAVSKKARRQEFLADDFSKNVFLKNSLEPSIDNVWAMELSEDNIFAYELRRPDRFFRLEFDFSMPIE